MSVRISSACWDHSKLSGSELLMMLAIADFADDQGNAYPAVATLADKCRMSRRNANFVLASLRASGELEVRTNEGPKGCNRYRIRIDPLKPASPPEAGFTPKDASVPEADFTLKPTTGTPEAGFPKPLKPASDEPSLNHHEPSVRSLARPRAPKLRCPFQDIVAAYHEVLPELPAVKLIDAKGRRNAIAAFWGWVLSSSKSDGTRRAADEAQGLAWIRSYFQRARASDFIMGRVSRAAGHQAWEADFDYLLSEKGKRQVIEKTREAT